MPLAISIQYFRHTDHLNSTSVISDSTGMAVEGSTVLYAPFGEVRSGVQSGLTDFGYTGQRLDSASGGLMYYGARYYLPGLRRFVSADTVVPSAVNGQALNRYSYVFNNPLKYVDPSGHVPCIDGILCGGSGTRDRESQKQAARAADRSTGGGNSTGGDSSGNNPSSTNTSESGNADGNSSGNANTEPSSPIAGVNSSDLDISCEWGGRCGGQWPDGGVHPAWDIRRMTDYDYIVTSLSGVVRGGDDWVYDPYGRSVIVETPYEQLSSRLQNVLSIDSTESVYILYAHMRVEPPPNTDIGMPSYPILGAVLDQGIQIGFVGSTGNSTGDHLHFEVRVGPANQEFGSIVHDTPGLTLWLNYEKFRAVDPHLLFDN